MRILEQNRSGFERYLRGLPASLAEVDDGPVGPEAATIFNGDRVV